MRSFALRGAGLIDDDKRLSTHRRLGNGDTYRDRSNVIIANPIQQSSNGGSTVTASDNAVSSRSGPYNEWAVGPLSGICVLDLSGYIAGPYGCTLLADLGAEVIKIEPPAGDQLRHYPSTLEGESRAFLGTNRGKRGIVLDLKQPEGLEVLMRLVKSADVLVHNFRPAVAPRLGITYEQLKRVNPRIIYCALTGFGETGPMKDKAGYDQVLQSMTGICTFQGRDEPEIVYGSVVDFYAAALIAYGVSSALFHREKTGEGQAVNVSLLQAALAMQSGRFIWAEGEPRDVSRDMRSGGITGIHPTREGYIYLSANTAHFWQALCELTGLPELATNPNYDTIRKRAQRAAELIPILRTALMARTAVEWEAIFGENVPCSAVRSIDQMFDHPQVVAEGLVHEFEHPTVGSYRGMVAPLKFSASSPDVPCAAPALGEHTDRILADSGYSEEEIEGLRRKGVIPVAPQPE
jgi:crotonobetainyl-CoA:carnitine CoA-transferase CaiB-like acyl-CoA transferase